MRYIGAQGLPMCPEKPGLASMLTTLSDQPRRFCRPWLHAWVALCLASCGGGGGGSPPTTGVSSNGSDAASAGVLQQGRFIDSPVIGVAYKTATQSGYTGVYGDFAYRTGESVTFSIGKVVFPTVPASALVTPLTLAGADLTDPKVANMAYLLQKLDADGNSANGLVIDKRLIDLATDAIDFNQETADFVLDAKVKALLKANTELTGVEVGVTPEAAVEDLAKNLLGALDSDTSPSKSCAPQTATMSGSRTALSGNLWADVFAKPNNKFGWFYDSNFTPRGGTPLGDFVIFKTAASRPEYIAASLSEHWDSSYSPKQDLWLKHSQYEGVMMRVAAYKSPAESKTMPGFIGNAIYLHYVGPPGTYLELVFGPQQSPTVFFSFVPNSASLQYFGTAGKDGVINTGDDGYYPKVVGEGWQNHQPGDKNFPPSLRMGGTSPNGRQLPIGTCWIKSGGSVLLWTRPSNRVDLFFSPNSEVNKWGWMAPLYDDALGYQGSVGIREGSNKLNIISGVVGGQ